MNVASEDLSRELHELSGWDDTLYYRYERTDPNSTVPLQLIGNSKMGMTVNNASTGFTVDEYDHLVPAYDLGYLLRKLPKEVDKTVRNGRGGSKGTTVRSQKLSIEPNFNQWYAGYKGVYGDSADTPEDALALLAIELFKAGLLKQQEEL